jgi:hypothetical protein
MDNKGDILASVLKDYKECCFFLHNTREFNIVDRILKDGFIFENQLHHSTDRVNPEEPIEITYFLFHRKDYGMFTIIIAIPCIIFDSYAAIAMKNNTGIEEVLTTSEPCYSENDELVYTLSQKHVLGYFNNKTSEFYQNPSWDRFYNNNRFTKEEINLRT